MNSHTLFSGAEVIDLDSLQLIPVSAEIPIAEVHMFQAIIKHNPDIVKAFPTFANASNDFTEAELEMSKYAFGYWTQKRFAMFIKCPLYQGNPTVGMMWLDSPDSPLGLGRYWTLDFFLIKELRNQGLMSGCVQNLMVYCRINGLKHIRAVVTDNNEASIGVLLKNSFVHNTLVSSDSVEVFDKNL